jgi:hypothetical protein
MLLFKNHGRFLLQVLFLSRAATRANTQSVIPRNLCYYVAEPGAQRATTSFSRSLSTLSTSHIRMHVKCRHVTRIIHLSSLHPSSLRHLLRNSELFTRWDHVVAAFPTTGPPGILSRQLRSHGVTSIYPVVYPLLGRAIVSGRERRIWKFRPSILDAWIESTDLAQTRTLDTTAQS